MKLLQEARREKQKLIKELERQNETVRNLVARVHKLRTQMYAKEKHLEDLQAEHQVMRLLQKEAVEVLCRESHQRNVRRRLDTE